MSPSKAVKVVIGAHVSTARLRTATGGQAGGLATAIPRAQAIGAEAIQIFGASPRQWRVRVPSKEEVLAFRQAAKAAVIGPVFLHAPYLINLASPELEMRRKSSELLMGHLNIAEAIGAEGVIVHIGSGKEMPKAEAEQAVVQEVRTILKSVSGRSKVILENSAGGGQKLGSTLKELGRLLDQINEERVGACFDSAHAFEAGVVVNYDPESVAKLAEDISKTLSWERLTVIHANDSKTTWNSHHDRHENIGQGYIGRDGFVNLLRHPQFRSLPWLLEVPGFAGEGPDKQNVDLLRELSGR